MIHKTFIYIVGIASAILLTSSTNCACGTYSSGITHYSVNGTDCCYDIALDAGAHIDFYVQNSNGTWEYSHSTYMLDITAQNNCCNPL